MSSPTTNVVSLAVIAAVGAAAAAVLLRARRCRRPLAPRERKRTLKIGCGAGYQGDRVLPAAELLAAADLDYLFLECLAERTLAIAHARMKSGGSGYDPRLPQWLATLLPLAARKGTKLVANLGAADPRKGAMAAAFVVGQLGLTTPDGRPLKVVGVGEPPEAQTRAGGAGAAYTYLGADTVLRALQEGADVVITGRVADPSMLVGIVAYEFGWADLDDPTLATPLAAATCCGHLLECGFHLTGGFFFHPSGRRPTAGAEGGGAHGRDAEGASMAAIGLPYATVRDGAGEGCLRNGSFHVHKAAGAGGELSVRTCTQQLLYEVHDLQAYITPDVVADFSGATMSEQPDGSVQISGIRASAPRPPTLLQLIAEPRGLRQVCEVSFGGAGCVARSQWARTQVLTWLEQECEGASEHVRVSRPGLDALFGPAECAALPDGLADDGTAVREVRLRFEGVFPSSEGALALAMAFGGLGVGGPAGVCGGFFGLPHGTPVISIAKSLVPRHSVRWRLWQHAPDACRSAGRLLAALRRRPDVRLAALRDKGEAAAVQAVARAAVSSVARGPAASVAARAPASRRSPERLPAGTTVRLGELCHSRAGDKGNVCNVSLISFDEWRDEFDRIARALTPEVVRRAFTPLLDHAAADELRVSVYRMAHLPALNLVLEPILDGGVSVSRRLDPHGKSLSDLLLSISITL